MSGYLRVLKRKAGILDTQPVALATLSGELSPVSLVNCDQPAVLPFNKKAPLRVPEKKNLKIMGPKPMNLKQSALAKALVSEKVGLFGALADLVGDDSQLVQLQSGLAESLVMSKAPSTFGKYLPLVSRWELFTAQKGKLAFPADMCCCSCCTCRS